MFANCFLLLPDNFCVIASLGFRKLIRGRGEANSIDYEDEDDYDYEGNGSENVELCEPKADV